MSLCNMLSCCATMYMMLHRMLLYMWDVAQHMYVMLQSHDPCYCVHYLCSFRGFGENGSPGENAANRFASNKFPLAYWRELAGRFIFIFVFEVSNKKMMHTHAHNTHVHAHAHTHSSLRSFYSSLYLASHLHNGGYHSKDHS